jgi:hypothetical protein
VSVRTIFGVLVIAGLVVGCGGSAASQAPSATVAPSTAATIGGTASWKDGPAPVTTVIDATRDGTAVSGSAVTTFGNGTHTVKVECAKTYGAGWAIGGTVEETTLPGESAGGWSAVIVRDGSPQTIGVWLSAGPEDGATCDAFLSSFDPLELDDEAFHPIETGELVPPA